MLYTYNQSRRAPDWSSQFVQVNGAWQVLPGKNTNQLPFFFLVIHHGPDASSYGDIWVWLFIAWLGLNRRWPEALHQVIKALSIV